MTHPLLTLALAASVMTAAWPVSLWLADASIVDVLWAPLFVLLAGAVAAANGGARLSGWIALGLAAVWAARLGGHILRRRRKSGTEDHRYTAIRHRLGPRFALVSLFIVFWLQALLLWLVSWPLQAAVATPGPVTLTAMAGWAMTLAGIAIEAKADAQLAAFTANPVNAGHVLDTGLWGWSRHPNYFGDFLIWWGFFLAGIGGGAPWWTILSPVTMSALLMHFSGAGLMEETIADRRPAYRAYAERTSAFFPWPPGRHQGPPERR